MSSPTIQSSLCDEQFTQHPNRWVETHGYHRLSLRDTTALGHTFSWAITFSPDGRRLAVLFWENGASAGVQIINLITGNANIYVVRLQGPPTM